ncbi:MAG TPA: PQQ-binding-like beta-propeller repeat protein [Tepidisphaeraceae bacterium]|nr:PQQ-binding-like beta-propeller repeat protein [Tepidisphaeraceae bacterium]
MPFLKLLCTAALLTLAATINAEVNSTRRILAADSSTHRIAIVTADGKVLWQRKIGDIHDLHQLPDGNILFQDSYTHLLEVTPGMHGEPDKVVWEYDSGKMNGNEGKKVQVHAFQRLPNGNTMISESGIGRIIEVDRDGKIVHEIKLKLNHPSTHSDTRLARELENGHYLVSHENDGAVREYDHDGNVVWEFEVPMFGHKPAGGHGPEAFGNHTFAPLRLANGNTLISTGNGHGILEVKPDKKIVWSLSQDELPGIQLAWVTTLQILPNGHIVFGNCHATEKNPQIIEIDKDKHVVWTYKDFKTFGNALSNSEILPN